jgi:sugar lactone lactonase YvrE
MVVLLVPTSARADKLVLVAGGTEPDGTPALVQPFGVDFADDGTVYIVEMAKGERLRAVTPSGMLITLAGTFGEKGNAGDGGPAAKATFNGMHSLAVGPEGLVYLADTWNNRVRVFDPKAKTVNAFAGTGDKGYAGDGGPAVKAKFTGCFCVCFSPDRKAMFITDLDTARIRKVDMASGTVTTVAGTWKKGQPKENEDATSQPLVDPRATAVDSNGNLYILERGGHALRVVNAAGRIRTVAGTGKPGSGVGKALESPLRGPKHLCIDRDGSVLIADTENHRIVRYSPGKETLELVAGTGKKGNSMGDGDPKLAEFSQPHGVIVHPKTGEIYISDANNGRVLKITTQAK